MKIVSAFRFDDCYGAWIIGVDEDGTVWRRKLNEAQPHHEGTTHPWVSDWEQAKKWDFSPA